MAIWLVLQFVLCLFLFLLTSWFMLYFKYQKYLKKFPGATPIPIFGHALKIRKLSEFLQVCLNAQEEHGGIVQCWLGFRPPALLISDPKALEFFLGSTKVLEKSHEYQFFSRWLGTGLLTSSSTKWKKHRKILTPAFHFQILEQFLEVFDVFSDILIEKLKKESGKPSVNIYSYITLCSLDIICASAMGTVVNAQKDSDSDYVRSVKQICRILMERMTSVLKINETLYHLTSDYRQEKICLQVLHGYTKSVIALRKQELENNTENDKEVKADDIAIKRKKTFLDLLLQYRMEGETISDEDIQQEVDTFMFEGHDTTSSGITFVLYCLANHSAVQEKVIDELREIFADDKRRPATYKDLQEMKYLELSIKESLRLYPSVPVITRRLTEDIEYDGSILPKNVTLILFPYGVHRCKDIYPDPERFDPERFTLENQAKRSPYAYIPFSAGPRNCIGQRFAMLEMKSVVSKILRNYELLPAYPKHEVKLVGEIILKSSNGVCISLKDRKF